MVEDLWRCFSESNEGIVEQGIGFFCLGACLTFLAQNLYKRDKVSNRCGSCVSSEGEKRYQICLINKVFLLISPMSVKAWIGGQIASWIEIEETERVSKSL